MNRLFALIRLRFRLAGRRFRGGAKWTDRVVALLLGGLGIAVSLGMAVGFWFMIRQARFAGDLGLLSSAWHVVLWSCAFFGLFLPLLRGGSADGIDPEQLLLFPVSRLKLFAFFLIASFLGGAHLFYYPWLIAAAAAALLPPGPGSFAGLAVLSLVVVVIVAWGNMLMLVVRVLMARRRLRELIILGGMVLLILSCLIPAMMERYRATATGEEKMAEVRDLLGPVARFGSLLPPSIAARSLCPPQAEDGGGSGWALFSLAIWAAAGLGAGYGLFLREQTGTAPARKTTATAAPRHGGADVGPFRRSLALLGFLPPAARAVALKDLRYLVRSVLGRFSLLMAPVLVLIFVFIFSEMIRRPLPGIDSDRVLLFSTLLYLAFLSNNFFNNAFAWDGTGAQSYFLHPVELRHVLLGKNMAVWVFNGLIFIISMTVWAAATSVPSPGTVFTGLCVFAVTLLLLAMGGNLASVAFPVGRNPAAFMGSPSQVGILTGIGTMLVSVVLCGGTLLLPALFGLAAWQPLFMTLLLACLALLYRQFLGVAARLWAGRQETFLQNVRRSA